MSAAIRSPNHGFHSHRSIQGQGKFIDAEEWQDHGYAVKQEDKGRYDGQLRNGDIENEEDVQGEHSVYVPKVDLDWESFQVELVGFLNSIDAYVSSSKTEIARQSQLHVEQLKALRGDKAELEKKIADERDKERRMLTVLEQERTNISDLTSSLQRLNISLSKLKEQNGGLEGELNKLKREIGANRGEKERQKGVLDEQRSKDGPELSRMQELLGWKVEGVKEGVLLMRFTQIDPAQPEKEYSLVIDVSKAEYEVTNCSPVLPTLNELVLKLNEDRQFYSFVKRVRHAFRQTVAAREEPGAEFFSSVKGLGSASVLSSANSSTTASPAV